MTTSVDDRTEAVPGDLRMVRRLWPFLVASAVSLLPFTVFATFLVPIAETAGGSVASVGGMRGLGGLSALLTGVALAPLLDRLHREWVAAAGLALLGVAAALGAAGTMVTLAVFCVLVGASTALLGPALGAAAADRFGSGAAAGRAATLVTATTSMTAMLAAPLIALPALLWGWRGNLLAVAACSVTLAAGFAVRLRRRPRGPVRSSRTGYLAGYRALARIPGAVPLLMIGLLRTAAFMGYLAYLAGLYDERFGLSPSEFAFVWTLSGASFFVGNLLAGRYTASARPWIGPERVLPLALLAATGSVVGFYLAPALPLALALTALMGASHATVAACVVSLLVRRTEAHRGTALALNAAGQSLGVFLGAAAGAAGLSLAGYPGAALAFGTTTALALLFATKVRHR
jgi:predicted MFS family arabinose efflux permease